MVVRIDLFIRISIPVSFHYDIHHSHFPFSIACIDINAVHVFEINHAKICPQIEKEIETNYTNI